MLTKSINNTQKAHSQSFAHNAVLISTSALLVSLVSFNVSAANSDSFAPGDSDSKWVVGGYIGSFNNPLIGDNDDEHSGINIEYRGEKLFVKDNELGYNLYRNTEFSVGILIMANSSLLSDRDEYKDNQKLAGIKERDSTLDAGIYLMHRNSRGRLKVAILDEITGKHGGMSADLNYMSSYNINSWIVSPYLGAKWNSSNMVNYFYGVSTAEATAERAVYNGSDTANLYIGVNGRYDITKNWDIELGTTYIHIGKGILDSSIIDSNYVISSHIGVNYNF